MKPTNSGGETPSGRPPDVAGAPVDAHKFGSRARSASPPWFELRTSEIVAVVKTRQLGSINAAARELGMTHSRLSKAISRIEGRLGMPLFVRSVGGVRPADGALPAFTYFERIAQVADEVPSNTSKSSGPPALRIGGPAHSLVPCISALGRAFAKIPHRFSVVPLGNLARSVASDALDVAIAYVPIATTSDWHTTEVGSSPLRVFASPSTVAVLEPFPCRIEKILQHQFVLPPSNDDSWNEYYDGFPADIHHRRVGHETSSSIFAAMLAASSNHLVVLPWRVADAFVQRGELACIPVVGMAAEEPVWVSVHVDRVSKTQEKLLLTALREHLRKTRPTDLR